MKKEGVYNIVEKKTYDEGEVIFNEDSMEDGLFIIISGSVETSKTVQGRRFVIETLQPGDIFGEMGIIEDSVRSASVYAVEETVCLAANAMDVDRLSGTDKFAFGYVLYRLFSQCLANRLRSTSEKLIEEIGEGVDFNFEWK